MVGGGRRRSAVGYLLWWSVVSTAVVVGGVEDVKVEERDRGDGLIKWLWGYIGNQQESQVKGF